MSSTSFSIPEVVLLLGTSHVGKSTCAAALAAWLDRPHLCTDTLARHPGRPWTGVPAPVLEHYTALSAPAIHWFLKVHHANLRSPIAAALRTGPMVAEGAALRPEFRADWPPGARAVCLHARDEVIRERVLRSRGDVAPDIERATEAFLVRSLTENRALTVAAAEAGLACIDTSDMAPAAVRDAVVAGLTD